MKKELIKTDNYLLVVDDSSINFDDWVYDELDTLFFQYGVEHKKLNSSAKKVIAHLPFGMYSSLEGVPLLPSLEVEDDVEELGNEFSNGFALHLSHQLVVALNEGFKAGYNKAREKYIKEIDKQISDFKHDLKESTSTFVKQNCEGAIFGLMRLKESLSQPKTPTHFEFEMRDALISPMGREVNPMNFDQNQSSCIWQKVIKTTTNSQGQEVACGKYIY